MPCQFESTLQVVISKCYLFCHACILVTCKIFIKYCWLKEWWNVTDSIWVCTFLSNVTNSILVYFTSCDYEMLPVLPRVHSCHLGLQNTIRNLKGVYLYQNQIYSFDILILLHACLRYTLPTFSGEWLWLPGCFQEPCKCNIPTLKSCIPKKTVHFTR